MAQYFKNGEKEKAEEAKLKTVTAKAKKANHLAELAEYQVSKEFTRFANYIYPTYPMKAYLHGKTPER